MNMPVITLRSGLRVGNFSSPHPFNFASGEVLPACSAERATNLKLVAKEIETPGPSGVTLLDLSFELDDASAAEAARIIEEGAPDIVLVPLPFLVAWKAAGHSPRQGSVTFATIRSADRVTKVIHPDRFCV